MKKLNHIQITLEGATFHIDSILEYYLLDLKKTYKIMSREQLKDKLKVILTFSQQDKFYMREEIKDLSNKYDGTIFTICSLNLKEMSAYSYFVKHGTINKSLIIYKNDLIPLMNNKSLKSNKDIIFRYLYKGLN